MSPSLARLRQALQITNQGKPPELVVVERTDLLTVLQLADCVATTQTLAGFQFNSAVCYASWRGTPLRLSRCMFYALYAIITLENGASYRDIYDAMTGHPGHIGGRNGDFKANVRSMIKRLRRQLQAHGVPIQCLKCRFGSGYYWDEKEADHGL